MRFGCKAHEEQEEEGAGGWPNRMPACQDHLGESDGDPALPEDRIPTGAGLEEKNTGRAAVKSLEPSQGGRVDGKVGQTVHLPARDRLLAYARVVLFAWGKYRPCSELPSVSPCYAQATEVVDRRLLTPGLCEHGGRREAARPERGDRVWHRSERVGRGCTAAADVSEGGVYDDGGGAGPGMGGSRRRDCEGEGECEGDQH